MSRPSHGGYSVHTNELRDEAKTWSEQSHNLGRIVHERDGLRVDRVEAGVFQLVVTAYGPLLDHVMELCGEGQRRMEEVVNALNSVANSYEKAESDGVRLFGARF